MDFKKYPKGIILLILFFGWSALMGINTLAFRQNITDTLLWSHYGIGILFYLITLVAIGLSGSLIYFYIKKKELGYKITFVSFGVDLLITIIGGVLIFLDTEIAKGFIEASRLERGLSVESIDAVVSPSTLGISIVLAVVFYAVLGYYVRKNKSYFSEK